SILCSPCSFLILSLTSAGMPRPPGIMPPGSPIDPCIARYSVSTAILQGPRGAVMVYLPSLNSTASALPLSGLKTTRPAGTGLPSKVTVPVTLPVLAQPASASGSSSRGRAASRRPLQECTGTIVGGPSGLGRTRDCPREKTELREAGDG